MTARGIAMLVAVLAACGHPAPPRQPAGDVRAEIAAAEKAELARQHEVARAHYRAAVAAAKDPESIDYARRNYAQTLASWMELGEAIAQLEGAVAARPDDAEAWHDLGILRSNEGDELGALDALGKAKALVPDDTRPRIALAILKWKRGDRAGAAAEYRELLELDLPDRLREKVKWALRELAKPKP